MIKDLAEIQELTEIITKNCPGDGDLCDKSVRDCNYCEAQAIHDAGYRRGPFKILIDEAIDNCTATDEEIKAWLAEPTESAVSKVIEALLTNEQKVLIAKRVVMCRKVAQAQADSDFGEE